MPRQPLPHEGQPTADIPDHLSGSAMNDYLGCSLRYFLGRILSLPQPVSASLHLGKAVHAGLQAFHIARWRGTDASEEAVLQAYRGAFVSLEEESDDPVAYKEGEREKVHAKGEDILRAYLGDAHAQSPERTVGVEVGLRERLVPEVPVDILGYVDLVREVKNGGLAVCDFKTVASRPDTALEAFRNEAQLTLYQTMVERATGERVVRREIVFLTKHKQPLVIAHPMPPADNAAKERVLAMMGAAWEGIRAGRWHPQPGMHCGWCAFRGPCARWRGGVS